MAQRYAHLNSDSQEEKKKEFRNLHKNTFIIMKEMKIIGP